MCMGWAPSKNDSVKLWLSVYVPLAGLFVYTITFQEKQQHSGHGTIIENRLQHRSLTVFLPQVLERSRSEQTSTPAIYPPMFTREDVT